MKIKQNKKEKSALNKILLLMIISVFLIMFPAVVYTGEKASQKVVDFAHSALVNLGTDPVIVKAVRYENEKKKSLVQIKEMNEKWKATPGIADYMKAMMDSECGKHLKEIQKTKSFYAELFVMDNLGANVCMSNKTSDYWQGDEAKFIRSYNKGEGAVHIGKVKFDDSTRAYLSQVSVPVRDAGKVIGAVTIGIDIERFKIDSKAGYVAGKNKYSNVSKSGTKE
jgi:hypothetical protein